MVDVFSTPMRKRYYKAHPRASAAMRVIGPIVTYHLVAIADVLFRSASLAQAGAVIAGVVSGIGATLPELSAPPRQYVWIALPAYVLAEIGDYVRRHPPQFSEWPRAYRWAAYASCGVFAGFLAVAFLAGKMDKNPFLYAIF
jgi:hypothetical protein